jgi:hypothetical protein
MVRAFGRHRVRDYDAWRAVYDGFADVQKEHGVKAEAVFRMLDDPDDVVIIHDFADAETARAFFAMPELKDAMQKAGVEGEFTLWLAEEA